MNLRRIMFRIIFAAGILIYVAFYMAANLLIDITKAGLSLAAILALLVPALVWCGIMFLYYTRMDKVKRSKAFIICFMTIGMLIWTFSFYKLTVNERNSYFDPHKWANRPVQRVLMVHDFLKKHPLHGLTRQEVKELIGEPDDTGYFHADHRYVYHLGPEGGLVNIDDQWLLIDFDPTYVANYRIVTD